jgi:cytochrome bd-type quinol oxidase subunit 2
MKVRHVWLLLALPLAPVAWGAGFVYGLWQRRPEWLAFWVGGLLALGVFLARGYVLVPPPTPPRVEYAPPAMGAPNKVYNNIFYSTGSIISTPAAPSATPIEKDPAP